MEDKIRIRKVHIQSLIDTLAQIWDRGVDFVDVHGIIENGQDTIALSFCKAYMDEEYQDEFDTLGEEQFPSTIDIKLKDEDLDDLI